MTKQTLTKVDDNQVRQYVIEQLNESEWHVTHRYRNVDSDNWTCWPSGCFRLIGKSQYKRFLVGFEDWDCQ